MYSLLSSQYQEGVGLTGGLCKVSIVDSPLQDQKVVSPLGSFHDVIVAFETNMAPLFGLFTQHIIRVCVSVSVSVCVYMRMRVCICVCACVCVCARAPACVCVCVCV